MRRRARRGVRGAVLAEFVIAVLPFLMLSFVIAQFSVLAVGRILTKHAAYLGARAAIVTCTEPGKAADGMAELDKAVTFAFGPATKLGKPKASITQGKCDETNQEMLTVTVETTFKCNVPMGNMLLCGGTTKTLKASSTLPNQGTFANKIWGAK